MMMVLGRWMRSVDFSNGVVCETRDKMERF